MRKLFNLFILAALLIGLAGMPGQNRAAAQPSTGFQPPARQFTTGGIIDGRVKPAQAGLIVQAVDQAKQVAASSVTDEQGAYSLKNLAPGLYRLEVLTRENTPLHLEDAQMVQIKDAGEVVQARSLKLAPEALTFSERGGAAAKGSGTIQGTVTGAGGGVLADTYISAYSVGENYSYETQTDANGVYTFTLSAGRYQLRFYRFTGDNEFAPEWYNNQPDRENADLLTVVDGAVLSGIDVELAVGGTLSGTVTDESLNPITFASVNAIDSDGNHFSYDYTLSDGTYQLKGLPAGDLRVQFNPQYSSHPDHIKEYYDNQPDLQSADRVAVTLGNHTPNINAQLTPGGAITGTLRAADGGAPLAGLIYLYNSHAGDQDSYTDSYYTIDGEYEFHGLAPGVYYLRARPAYDSPYLGEYYENQAELAQATPLTVIAGDTEQANFALELGATITGQVLGTSSNPTASAMPQGTSPIADVYVTLYNAERDRDNGIVTDAQGYYTFTALASGTYYLGFSGNNEQNYISEYYNGKALLEEADHIQVTAPQATQIDVELIEGGFFSGRVTTAESGTPLQGVSSQVYTLDECNNPAYVTSVSTDASGYYTVTGLITGTYYVNFETDYAPEPAKAYLGQPYRATSAIAQINSPNGGGGDTPSDLGTPIQVTPGYPLSGVNAALQRGGQITGQITAEDSSLPLSDVSVQVYTPDRISVNFTYVDANGIYTTSGLVAGSYILWVDTDDDGTATSYIQEYYNDQLFSNQAITIPVTLGAVTPNIDISLKRGAQISGQVIAGDTSEPLEGVGVYLHPKSNGIVGYSTTDENGNFTSTGVPPGQYIVQFDTNKWYPGIREYVREYYNNQLSSTEATVITLTTATLYPGYDASLNLGGSISGTVTAESDGTPLEDVYIHAMGTSGGSISYAYTDQNGLYRLYGLPAGPVKVSFNGPVITQHCQVVFYANEYYNNKPNFDTADAVTVIPPNTTPNINASLGIEGIKGLIELFLPVLLRP